MFIHQDITNQKRKILNISKNGNYYWVETTIMPFKDHNGKIEKYVAIRFDISKQKESEALKRQTEALLAAQRDLEESNTELEAQTQKLQASEEELRVQQEELMQIKMAGEVLLIQLLIHST